VGYESGALHAVEYDATGALQSDATWSGIGGSGFWAEDGAGHPFLADNTRTTLAHLYRRDGERMEEVAAFASSSVLVVDAVGRADGVAVLVSHNAGATLAGVTTTAWGASLVVFDGLGSLESVTALPVEAPRGFFKPSEGRSWEGDLALVGTGSRSGTFGVWWEPVDAAGALTGTPFEMPDIEPDGFVPFRARPWSGGVLAAARDLAVVDRFKAALARYDGRGGGEILEVTHGPNADTWLATASDGTDVFVAMARLDDGTLAGQAVTGPVLVRVER
jgi:hypothetical protein